VRRTRLRILFFAHNLGKLRHFDGVLARLARRGHQVTIAVAEKKKGLRRDRVSFGGRHVPVVACPTRRVDAWAGLAPSLRHARDYLRFFDAGYQDAAKLAARAADYVPDEWRRRIEQRAWLRHHPKAAGRLLGVLEDAIPADPYLTGFIQYQEPDLVLVTPLVNFGSYQTDYVKAARHLGLPVVFVPFSWDNLTNRGVIKAQPDRVLVWNDIQRREAVELHGVPADRVLVTGAPRFDEFFTLEPSQSREAFCAGLGLDPARLVLLYVCSSPFVAPREVEFVRRWISEVRMSGYAPAAEASIVVRPHPVHAAQWADADFSDLPGVAVWRAPQGLNADQGLYDSLAYAAAVVGLNTSAMLEAAIVGRPVLTILAPEFTGGQTGTLHFHYLRWENGGVVTSADDFEAHRADLERAIRREGERRTRARAFAESFLRPAGGQVSRIVAAEIERSADLRPSGPGLGQLWRLPTRLVLRGVAARTGGRQRGARRRTGA
jgi:hypothetical protein